jgi:hypothetical protein
VEVGSRRTHVKATSLKGTEPATAWKRIVSEQSNFGGYEKNTDREIPVVRLTPVA